MLVCSLTFKGRPDRNGLPPVKSECYEKNEEDSQLYHEEIKQIINAVNKLYEKSSDLIEEQPEVAL